MNQPTKKKLKLLDNSLIVLEILYSYIRLNQTAFTQSLNYQTILSTYYYFQPISICQILIYSKIKYPTNYSSVNIYQSGIKIINNQKVMKFKKEYRWLLFLLAPFIIFLLLHFLVPLQFTLNSQPLATEAYNFEKSRNYQTLFRAQFGMLAQVFNDEFQRYQNILTFLSRGLLVKQMFLTNQLKENSINNAFQFNIANKNINSSVMSSMWFSKNVQNYSGLDLFLQQIYNNYIINQNNLQSYFLNSLNQSEPCVGSVYLVFNSNKSIVFEFPSKNSQSYSAITNSLSSQYQQLKTQYSINNSNNQILIVNDSKNQQILFCNNFRRDNATLQVFCLKVKLQRFVKKTNISFELFSHENTKIQLLSTFNNVQNFSHLIIIQNGKIYTQKIGIEPSFLQIFKNSQLNADQSFKYYRKNGINFLIKPIKQVSFFQSQKILYLIVQNSVFSATKDDLSNYTYESIINTLLIPTIIIICISVAISVFILRFILNSLDLELNKLNQRCKFIVEGDIDIHIPQYNGTQDIVQVYEEIKIINKLHRYTSKSYFLGHAANRILKYHEAIQTFKKLNYDEGYLLQNIGQAYYQIEQYQKSIVTLSSSIKLIEQQIEQQYGSLDQIFKMKQTKQKLPFQYKEKQIILIRRLWKLNFTYFKYVQLQDLNIKQLDDQIMSEEDLRKKKEKLSKDMCDNLIKIKRAFYPDYTSYAESVLTLLFEAKFYLSAKNYETAKECVNRSAKIIEGYTTEYANTTKKLLEKGSKNKFFFRKNRLSGHSRSHFNIMDAFYRFMYAILLANNPKVKDYFEAFNLLEEGLKKNLMSQSVNFLLINQLKKIQTNLKIDLQKFESTQIFRQSMPYKTLYYGPMTKEAQANFYKIPKSPAEVQLREIVIAADSSTNFIPQKQLQDQILFMQQKLEYVFEKLIKPIDRISIVKFNSESGVETSCSLTLKQSNENMLKSELKDVLSRKYLQGKTSIVCAITRIINRVKSLQCEKIIILCLKSIQNYEKDLNLRSYQKNKKNSIKQKGTDQIQRSQKELNIGSQLVLLIQKEKLRNCKIIFMCAKNDKYSKVIQYLGLREINRRIWQKHQFLNKDNNVIYVVDEKHKTDIDRILMSKLASYYDNHVFIF